MTTYNINFTDPQKSPIEVEEKGINTDLSVNFPGRIKLEWGEDVNENLLHLLENFAVQAEASDIDSPDSAESGGKLDSPIEGQLWFNKTNNKLYSYDGTRWVPHAEAGQHYGANWGQINHGEQLPLPVSPEGYAFSYDECIWSVSPFTYFNGFEYVQCFADSIDSTVTMIYGNSSGTVIEGVANYLIIGIQGNTNLGTFVTPLPIPSPTPSPTPDPSDTPTPTPSNSEIAPDPSNTPTPTPSNSENAPDPSDTPTPTPSNSENAPDPSNTPTPTPSNSEIAPDPSNTPTPTPSESSLPPLSVSDDSNLTFSTCDIGTDVNTESISVSATISITGGSGNYSISLASGCTGSTPLCDISSTNTSTGTLSASGTMPCQAGTFTSSATFNVTDTQTNETASGTATISVDIADLSLQ